MFFSPEMTRLRLPPGLPAAVREQIAAFNAQKAALKRELRETVVAYDGATAAIRDQAFESLADRQWPYLAELEIQADDIRRMLADRFEPTAPPATAPPTVPTVSARVAQPVAPSVATTSAADASRVFIMLVS